jgi:hypothetical protein
VKTAMTYEEAKKIKDNIETELDVANTILSSFPKGPMNLTSDAVRATPEWQAAKRSSEQTFAKLRSFNSIFVKNFKKEIKAERRLKYATN